jgi:23S rRNA pseudouridine1911/1915/1917 synthase
MLDPGPALELSGRRSITLDCGSGWQIHPRVSLLYLDTALAVVNKGPGLISVPAANAELSALSILQDFLAGRLRALHRGMAGKTLPPVYRRISLLPVHRLDQYTSGVFCIACNSTARGHLIEQLRAHTMRREYIAFAEGKTPARQGTWRQWLELSEDEMRQRIIPEASARAPKSTAQEAVTHFEVIAEYSLNPRCVVTKLRLRLETGRKHQIRVQAASAGLPLIGDRTYHPGYRAGSAQLASIDFPRQALHAELLTLEHPEQAGRAMTWKAELPNDLRQLEGMLRTGRAPAKP